MTTRDLSVGILSVGILGAAGATAGMLYCATGIPYIDQVAIRLRVVIYCALLGVPSRLVMLMLANEVDPRLPIDGQIGDRSSSLGPAVGPLQVTRALAKAEGWWSPDPNSPLSEREQYEALAPDLSLTMWWGIKYIKERLIEANGDWVNTMSLYNANTRNSTPYSDRALKLASKLGWRID